MDDRWRLNRILTIEAAAFDYKIDKPKSKPNLASPELDERTRAALALARLTERQKCRNEQDDSSNSAA